MISVTDGRSTGWRNGREVIRGQWPVVSGRWSASVCYEQEEGTVEPTYLCADDGQSDGGS